MKQTSTTEASHQSPGRALVTATATLVFLIALFPSSAYAASGDINTVLDSIRNWLAGLLAALATLSLMVGGVRYVIASGNPRMMQQGKDAVRSALVGYALAALAPMLVDILRRVIGAA